MLPTEKTPPVADVQKTTIQLHGDAKIGKSTFCSGADKPLFLDFEQGLNHLRVFKHAITSWKEFLTACAKIAHEEHEFKTIVVDTADVAYQQCAKHVCGELGITHESEAGYGKGFAMVNREFYRVLNKLASLPYGLILVSHSVDKELETPLGRRTKTVPTLPNKAREIVLAMVDIILYATIEIQEVEGKQIAIRVLKTKPHVAYEAGDRTGRLPDTIPLSWEAFATAWANGAQEGGQ